MTKHQAAKPCHPQPEPVALYDRDGASAAPAGPRWPIGNDQISFQRRFEGEGVPESPKHPKWTPHILGVAIPTPFRPTRSAERFPRYRGPPNGRISPSTAENW